MSCTNCIQINPLPRCVETDGVILLEGITFPEHPDTSLILEVINVATNRSTSIFITTDATGIVIETDGEASTGIDLTNLYNLMNHPYKINFIDPLTMQPVTGMVDAFEGCCLEFTTKQLTHDGTITASTDGCTAVVT